MPATMGFLDFVLGRRPPSPRRSYTIYCARNAPTPEQRRRRTRAPQARPTPPPPPPRRAQAPCRSRRNSDGEARGPPPDYVSTPPEDDDDYGASVSAGVDLPPPPDAPSPPGPDKDGDAIRAWRKQTHGATGRCGRGVGCCAKQHAATAAAAATTTTTKATPTDAAVLSGGKARGVPGGARWPLGDNSRTYVPGSRPPPRAHGADPTPAPTPTPPPSLLIGDMTRTPLSTVVAEPGGATAAAAAAAPPWTAPSCRPPRTSRDGGVPGSSADRATRGSGMCGGNPEDPGAPDYWYPRVLGGRHHRRRTRPWSCLRRLFSVTRHGDREPWPSSRRKGVTYSSRHVRLATGNASGSDSESESDSSSDSSGSSYSSSSAD